MMISLCKHRGVKSINVVRREEAAQELLAAGWVFHLKSPLFLNEAILALAMR
jgi:hypothetical protein